MPSYASRKIKIEQWRTKWNFTWQTMKRKKGRTTTLSLTFSFPRDITRKLRLYCKNQPITALADIWWVLSSLFTVKDSLNADGTGVTSLPVWWWKWRGTGHGVSSLPVPVHFGGRGGWAKITREGSRTLRRAPPSSVTRLGARRRITRQGLTSHGWMGRRRGKEGWGKRLISSVFLLSITSPSCSSSDIGAWFFCCIRSASFDLFRSPKFDGNLHDWLNTY